MRNDAVRGTEGYGKDTARFINATLAIAFEKLHSDFIPFIPAQIGHVLDVGAGIGRDAFMLAQMGHSVLAVEPTPAYRSAGHELYGSVDIEWIDDSLPHLDRLTNYQNGFDFILASGVWHHLDDDQQILAINRIATLLKPNGIFALSLRNGPAGVGTHVFATDGKKISAIAQHEGLTTLLWLDNQPSLMKNKPSVCWTKLVFKKQ